MSDNANQPISRTGSENSANGGHFDQGARRNNPSGNRNNRRRRPSQQIGGEQSANQSQRPAGNHPGVPAQQASQSGRQQNPAARQDSFQPRRNNNRPQRPNQAPVTNTITIGSPAGSNASSANIPQNARRNIEKPELNTERQIPAARNEKTDNQAFANRKNIANPAPHTERPREPRTWARNIRTEENYEDVRKENERIEKEIWLEIASIHTYKLD